MQQSVRPLRVGAGKMRDYSMDSKRYTVSSTFAQASGSAAFTSVLNSSPSSIDPAPTVSSMPRGAGNCRVRGRVRVVPQRPGDGCRSVRISCRLHLRDDNGTEPAATEQSMNRTVSAAAISSASSSVHCWRLTRGRRVRERTVLRPTAASQGPTPSSPRSVLPQARMRHRARGSIMVRHAKWNSELY